MEQKLPISRLLFHVVDVSGKPVANKRVYVYPVETGSIGNTIVIDDKISKLTDKHGCVEFDLVDSYVYDKSDPRSNEPTHVFEVDGKKTRFRVDITGAGEYIIDKDVRA